MQTKRPKSVGFVYLYRDGLRFDTGGREIHGCVPIKAKAIELFSGELVNKMLAEIDRLEAELQTTRTELQRVHAAMLHVAIPDGDINGTV